MEIIGKLYTCPYADSFLVEQRFEVTSNGDGTSTLIISSALNFVKSTIFKGMYIFASGCSLKIASV